jgi:hypothetical protein
LGRNWRCFGGKFDTSRNRRIFGKILQAIFGIQVAIARETCFKIPLCGKGQVIDVKWIY